MTVQKKLTTGQLVEITAEYKKELEGKVIQMHKMGYQFALCWNFHRDSMKAWEKAKRLDIEKITSVVRGMYIKESFGKELILVALNKGATYHSDKGIVPTWPAIEALQELGLIPVKTKISGNLRNPAYYDYKFAEPYEVVAFL